MCLMWLLKYRCFYTAIFPNLFFKKVSESFMVGKTLKICVSLVIMNNLSSCSDGWHKTVSPPTVRVFVRIFNNTFNPSELRYSVFDKSRMNKLFPSLINPSTSSRSGCASYMDKMRPLMLISALSLFCFEVNSMSCSPFVVRSCVLIHPSSKKVLHRCRRSFNFLLLRVFNIYEYIRNLCAKQFCDFIGYLPAWF